MVAIEIHVDYHQFWIGSYESPGPEWNAKKLLAGSLFAPIVGDQGVIVRTGIAMGPVLVDFHVLTSEPDNLDTTRDWEEVSEISVRPGGEELYAHTLMDDSLPIGPLNTNERSWHRVRAYATGRDLMYDLIAETPVEHYLIELWPAGKQDQKLLRSPAS